ncbi:hypothetical protein BS47DRAFT_1368525 [Hydnum rufescens UP504]|uniref:Uncharacterized protein n=1 Tax=Hydnum rufescens UP504 TaxID=1448309 RepID=A0A9P6AF83_9AGAM|nr:hypothetical protein BS47DRAFT_1368525 [Hydnum rufescens UP504]
MAKKYNCLLHQVLQLENIGDSFHSSSCLIHSMDIVKNGNLLVFPNLMLINPFHFLVSPGELQLKYAKEKEQFNGDADGLEAWLDDLRSLTQQSKNAIFFGSSEIQQLAKKQFNLKKSLEELFVKLMNEQLDATGISKWHEEAEKVQQEHKLKTRDLATLQPQISVPWVQLLALLCQHHIHFIGWLLEEECPAPHPSCTNKSWEGGQWRFLVSKFQKGNSCPLSLKDGLRMMLMMTLLSHWSLTGMVMQSAMSKMQG